MLVTKQLMGPIDFRSIFFPKDTEILIPFHHLKLKIDFSSIQMLPLQKLWGN